MKRLLLLFVVLIGATTIHAQTTSVTATVTDSDGIAWGNLSFLITFQPLPGYSGQYTYQGARFVPQQYSGNANSSGTMSVTIPDNSFISPSGTKWQFVLQPYASAQATQFVLSVTGATQNFTTLFSSGVKPPRFAATGGAFGYSTLEVSPTPQPGGQFWNVTAICLELWNGSSFNCSAGGGGTPAPPNQSIQINNVGVFGPGPQVSTVFIKPLPSDNVIYVSPNGNDSNDGLSWGSAKLTVYACLTSLPGGSAGVAGGGTCRISSPVAYGGPAANQGMWIMGPGDVNFASPPSGWLKKTTGAPINIECVLPALQYVNDHKSVCLMTGGGNSDLVHPPFWFSATTAINLKNIGFSNFLNTYGFIGIDSSGNRTGPGGTSQVSLDGLSWNHGSCRFGGGPGIDIGSQTFWIWMRNINGTGCDFGELAIAAPGVPGLSRSGNVVTATTTTTNSITAGSTQWVTITNATDPSFNGSFQVQSTPSGTQFTYNQTGPNATSGNGQVVTAAKAAINMDSGGGSGTGLIFLDDFQINGGNIRYVPGVNGGGFYVRNGDYEGDGTNLDPPVVLATAVTSPSNIVVENVEISDATIPTDPIPGVQIDNNNPSLLGAIVSRVDGGVKGAALLLGGTPVYSSTISMLRAGNAGFNIPGRIVGGGIDVARRLFGPAAVISPNIAAINPASWVYSGGTGTITANISSPDGLTNAGRATSNSGLSFVAFYNVGNVSINVGDAYVYGLWQRVNSGATSVAAPFFSLQSGGLGIGDSCTASPGGYTLFPQFSGDGQWIWMSGICKVATNPNLAGIILSGAITNPAVIDFYGPTLIQIPAGTKSDNELYEIALNLSSYAPTAAAGEVSLMPNQRLHHGTTAFANLGTPNNASDIYCTDCVVNSNPCVGTGTGAFAQGINGVWVCGGGGGGGGCSPGGITDALQYNAGGTCSFGGVNSPTVNGNYLVNYNVTASAAVPPTITIPGVPQNAQTGTTYTYLYSDRGSRVTANNSGAQTYTLVNPSSVGFGQNYFNILQNIGTAVVTDTASGFTIDGAASIKINPNWARYLFSDGVNDFSLRVPDLKAFPTCVDTGGNHINFDPTATNPIFCGTSASGNGLSGMTAGQVPIAASATSVTSSEALAGSGAAIVTGPATSVSTDLVIYTGTAGQTADSGVLLANVWRKDVANISAAVNHDFSAGTWKIPAGAGFTASATSNFGLDTTGKQFHCYLNNADAVCSALSSISPAVTSNTIANANNPQTWNWAQTTNTQSAMTFGETSAATGGTLTGLLSNQQEVSISTASASTATPLNITQGSITGTVAFPALQVQTTWNNASLAGQGLLLSCTNTSSASGSHCLNILGGASGSTSDFSVDPNGNVNVSVGNLQLAALSRGACTTCGVTYQGGLDGGGATVGAGGFRGSDNTSVAVGAIGGAATLRAGDMTTGTANQTLGGILTIRGGNTPSTASNAAGGAVSITGGGLTGAVTNGVGADITIQGGLGTGTGTPSHVIIKTPGFGAASGTTAQANVTRSVVHAKAGSTTSGTATNMFNIALANNQTAMARVVVHVETTQATPHNCSTGSEFLVVAQDTAGTVTTNVSSAVGLATICDTGTLTITMAASGAAPTVISVTPTWTTIVPTAVIITVEVENLSQQDVALL